MGRHQTWEESQGKITKKNKNHCFKAGSDEVSAQLYQSVDQFSSLQLQNEPLPPPHTLCPGRHCCGGGYVGVRKCSSAIPPMWGIVLGAGSLAFNSMKHPSPYIRGASSYIFFSVFQNQQSRCRARQQGQGADWWHAQLPWWLGSTPAQSAAAGPPSTVSQFSTQVTYTNSKLALSLLPAVARG